MNTDADAEIKTPMAVLKFPIPECEIELRQALDGSGWENVVWTIDQQLRSWLKYGNEFKTADDALEATRSFLRETMEDGKLNFSG